MVFILASIFESVVGSVWNLVTIIYAIILSSLLEEKSTMFPEAPVSLDVALSIYPNFVDTEMFL